ncbi:DUF177 domain-containing protein [Palleronia sp. LCG004]|uniref:YceD family protein n=1 Tax=Palleronia sp. LCG004 TaxID=3079304 RepID=UPI002943E45F|nr:DUF177 domain-containing protein [Palleronia sp. LCG004]WOI54933.1 DUF177 domain-containing protein [Palleronia sp. LCG004]
MTETARRSTPTKFRLSALSRTRPHEFEIVPDQSALSALAGELDLSALRKLRLTGELVPEGRSDWRLEAMLGATLVQPCGVTLEPVTTRVDEPVRRRYVEGLDRDALPSEQEMPEDDSVEALPDTLDLEAVMHEALILAVPPFPRAPGAEALDMAVTEPGSTPMTDDDAKPLAGLRDAMKRSEH